MNHDYIVNRLIIKDAVFCHYTDINIVKRTIFMNLNVSCNFRGACKNGTYLCQL